MKLFQALSKVKASLLANALIARFYDRSQAIIKSITGGAVIVMICSIFSVKVLPVVINGSDGGVGEASLPIFQVALILAGIMAAIGVIYVASKSPTSGGK